MRLNLNLILVFYGVHSIVCGVNELFYRYLIVQRGDTNTNFQIVKILFKLLSYTIPDRLSILLTGIGKYYR